MNPMLIFPIILGGIVLWFILSFGFHFIGKISEKIGKHTRDALDMDESEDVEKSEKENGGKENV